MFGPLGVDFSSRPLARVLVFKVDAPQAPVFISAVGRITHVDVRPLGCRFFLSALGQSTCFLKLMPSGVSCQVFPHLGMSPFCFYFLFDVEVPRCVFDFLLTVMINFIGNCQGLATCGCLNVWVTVPNRSCFFSRMKINFSNRYLLPL